MNILISLARFLKKLSKKIGNFCIAVYGWIFAITLYLPFIFTFYVIDYGFDHKRFLTLRGFREMFEKAVKGFLFPSEESIRKIGYIVVLPFLKSEEEESNPITSMFAKYFTSLQTSKDTKLNIAYEYIDGIHRKNNIFTIATFMGAGLLYIMIGAEIGVLANEALGGAGLGLLGGAVGVGYIGSSSLGGAGAPLLAIFGFLMMIISFIVLFSIFAVSFIMIGVSLLCFIWGFKEIKTQSNIDKFINANLSLMVSSLKSNYKDNDEALRNIETSQIATLESVKPEKVDFLKIEDRLLLKSENLKNDNN